MTAVARDALLFVDAFGLKEIDALGFSLGGHVAHEMALLRLLSTSLRRRAVRRRLPTAVQGRTAHERN